MIVEIDCHYFVCYSTCLCHWMFGKKPHNHNHNHHMCWYSFQIGQTKMWLKFQPGQPMVHHTLWVVERTGHFFLVRLFCLVNSNHNRTKSLSYHPLVCHC